eukprot:jgi/Pico_ML_1/52387/g3098.t1
MLSISDLGGSQWIDDGDEDDERRERAFGAAPFEDGADSGGAVASTGSSALVLDAAQKPGGKALDVDVDLDGVDEVEGVSGDVGREMRAQVEAFVKVGQALSSRPDLVPPAYIDALSRLQDRMPSFPHEVAMQVIEEDLGRKVEDVFVDMPRRPIAAASLGQVYKAKLRSNGHTVAVKVQRPGMAESIAMDMYLVREAAAWIDENLEKILILETYWP